MASEPRPEPAVPSGRAVTLGAVLWILTLEFFAGQAVAQAAWRTPYSLLTNSISDLGNTACGTWPPASVNLKSLGLSAQYICSPQHTVMNVAFILAGVLILAGLYLTRSQWPRRRLTAWGMALLAVAGVGKIIVGLVPENTVVLLHFVGALGIPCAVIGILLLGLATWSTRRGVAVTSLALALIGLLGPVITKIATGGLHDFGLAERLMEYPIFVWLALMGLVFLRTHHQAPAQAAVNRSGPRLEGLTRGAADSPDLP
jgi:hypothetical membrane protein